MNGEASDFLLVTETSKPSKPLPSMPGRAKSRLRRTHEASVAADAEKKKFLKQFQDEVAQARADGKKTPSIRAFCIKVDRPNLYSTLNRLNNGGRTSFDMNQEKSFLTNAEEEVLCQTILELSRHGFPLTHEGIKLYALEMIQVNNPKITKLGKNWVPRYLDKHRDRITMKWGAALSTSRACAVNAPNKEGYYNNLILIDKTFNVKRGNKYGMDETGIMMGKGQTQRVVAAVGTKHQHMQCDGNRENITVFETICADGTFLKPLVIFKGERVQSKWGKDNPLDASYIPACMSYLTHTDHP